MTISDIALQGLQRAESKVDTIAQKVAFQTHPNAEVADQVDLSEAAVGLIEAQNEASLNIKLLQTSDDLSKTIINLLG